MSTTTVRMADGDFYVVTDTPTHSHLCDGTGWSKDTDDADKIAVACPACRPHLARTRRGRVTLRH